LPEENNTVPFVFERNPTNQMAKNGIENLFPEELFEGFVKTITRPRGQENREFDADEKAAFEAFILARDNPADFINFEPLVQRIRELKEKSNPDVDQSAVST
jgi:hypothetical protein